MTRRSAVFPPRSGHRHCIPGHPIVLHARSDRCDVYVPRSLAASLWEWIIDAAIGCDRDQSPHDSASRSVPAPWQ